MKEIDPRKLDPSLDRRRLTIYFSVVAGLYVIGVALAFVTIPDVAMLFAIVAPTVAALVVQATGPAYIQWGRLNWWLLAGFIPMVACFAAYALVAQTGLIKMNTALLVPMLLSAPSHVLVSASGAAGEEIGWRGFLWPLLRRRWSFLKTSLVVLVIWWAYHVPLIALGWYGHRAGIYAFTVAIAGFSFFVGVLTDHSKSIWPSIAAHGSWNGLVLTAFAADAGGTATTLSKDAVFTGSTVWLGEFGWIAAITSLVIGVVATTWNVRWLRERGLDKPDGFGNTTRPTLDEIAGYTDEPESQASAH